MADSPLIEEVFELLLDHVVMPLAGGLPQRGVPELDRVTTVRLDVVNDLRRCRPANSFTTQTQRMRALEACCRFVPLGAIASLPGAATLLGDFVQLASTLVGECCTPGCAAGAERSVGHGASPMKNPDGQVAHRGSGTSAPVSARSGRRDWYRVANAPIPKNNEIYAACFRRGRNYIKPNTGAGLRAVAGC